MITFFAKFAATTLLVLSVAIAIPASAQVDAFSIEVAVADRGAAEQQLAYRAAMRRALLENSRSKTILNRSDVRKELNNAESYVDRFSYRTPDPGTLISRDTPITDKVRQSGQATQLMLVRFNREKLLELISRKPKTRKTEEETEAAPVDAFANVKNAVLWMLIQDDNRNIRISDTAAANVRDRARELAGTSGLSLTYPFGDEEDRGSVPLSILEAQDIDSLRLGSQRYQHDAILAATLSRSGGRTWVGRWTRIADVIVMVAELAPRLRP